MGTVVRPREALPTLVGLWSGKSCPHRETCACRTSSWCPKSKSSSPDSEPDFPMLHLAGCSFAYNFCCCRVLDEIEALAAEYLQWAGVDEPPVPLDVIGLFDPQRPIELRSLPLKKYFGSTWFLGDEWVVHLNSDDPVPVNNFTAFHEGFHIICRNTGLAFRRADERTAWLNERLADYFAASVLMPRPFVHAIWRDLGDVTNMAAAFAVPHAAMREWLIRLHLSPA